MWELRHIFLSFSPGGKKETFQNEMEWVRRLKIYSEGAQSAIQAWLLEFNFHDDYDEKCF